MDDKIIIPYGLTMEQEYSGAGSFASSSKAARLPRCWERSCSSFPDSFSRSSSA